MLICHYILFILFWNNDIFNRLWMIHHNKQLQKCLQIQRVKKMTVGFSPLSSSQGMAWIRCLYFRLFNCLPLRQVFHNPNWKKTFVSYGQLCAHGTYLQVSFLGSADSNFNLYYSSLFWSYLFWFDSYASCQCVVLVSLLLVLLSFICDNVLCLFTNLFGKKIWQSWLLYP